MIFGFHKTNESVSGPIRELVPGRDGDRSNKHSRVALEDRLNSDLDTGYVPGCLGYQPLLPPRNVKASVASNRYGE